MLPLHADGILAGSGDTRFHHLPLCARQSHSPSTTHVDFVKSITNSTVECEYEVNMESKILEKVECKERHAVQLEPFTTASVQSNILLTYVGSSRQTERKVFSSLTRKAHIIFELEVIQDPPLNTSLSEAKKMLSELVEHSIDEIKLSTISQFTDFVHWIKSSSDLMPLLEVVETCSYLTGEIACTLVEKLRQIETLKNYGNIQLRRLGSSEPCLETNVDRGSLVVKLSDRGWHVPSSSPIPLKTRRVEQRCTLNLSRDQTSPVGVVVRRGGRQLMCRPRHLIMVQNDEVRRQKPSCR
ncbi:apolipoprotein B-100 [Trichonephila clavipes]|nr:apolipoprotein B-100 [Trichonephila clavipes]